MVSDATTTTSDATRDRDRRYEAKNHRIFRKTVTGQNDKVEVVWVQLSNFSASIVEETVLDDGAESLVFFDIAGTLSTGAVLPTVRIPAAGFSTMSWVLAHWGARAQIAAGQSARDHLRLAIQVLSPEAKRRVVYGHLGWREADGQWLYLSATGAIGGRGIEVDPGSEELRQYALPLAPVDVPAAVWLSLNLLEVADLHITAPLLAAVGRAPLCAIVPCDVTLWLEGQTGCFKSTLAALFLSHWGEFDRLHLPASWISTANSLERRAFLAKDVLLVVDDYAPGEADARDLQQRAQRVLRAQGNRQARGRLRADLSARPETPPRGLLVVTGEQHPAGQSLVARLVLVNVISNAINLPRLSAAQATASRLPHAMAGYLAWLQPQMARLGPILRGELLAARDGSAVGIIHRRLPENIAHLMIGLRTYLRFADAIGACPSGFAVTLLSRMERALMDVAEQQATALLAERPVLRFLRALLALLSTHAHVLVDTLAADVDEPPTMLGWADKSWLYLVPEASYRAVSRFCRDSGDPFPIRQGRLLEELKESALSDSDEGRTTTTKTIGGRKRRVLKIARDHVELLLGESVPDPWKTPLPDRDEA